MASAVYFYSVCIMRNVVHYPRLLDVNFNVKLIDFGLVGRGGGSSFLKTGSCFIF